MGCDIHGVLQSRGYDGKFHTECEMEDTRNYKLFAILANVRNGYGFAGVPTHEAIQPIAEPRGLPEDFKVFGDEHVYGFDNRKEWLGDHSRTWLTATEIRDYPYWDTPIEFCGIIPKDVYTKRVPGSIPHEWSGGVWGRILLSQTTKIVF